MIGTRKTPTELPEPPQKVKKLVYFGTPEVSAACLRALCSASFEVSLAITNPPRPGKRGSSLKASPVALAASERGIRVSHEVEEALHERADLGIVVAFGRLIKPHILAKIPLVNLHFSLLPRWRGAAPLEHAILAGDPVTGVCLMQLEETLDTGGVYSQSTLRIPEKATLSELRKALTDLGSGLLIRSLKKGLGKPAAQSGEVTWAPKLTTDDFQLDWRAPAEHLHRIVRLERAWTTLRSRRLQITGASVTAGRGLAPGEISGTLVGTGAGGLLLISVKPEGRKQMPAEEWLRGARLRCGELLGS